MNINFKTSALFLLGSEILLILSSTWWPEVQPAPLYLTLGKTILFTVGGYLIAKSQRWFRYYLCFALLTILTGFIGHSQGAIIFRMICLSCVFGCLFWAIFQESFIRENVPKTDRIIAGLAGYLLLGLFWGSFYSTLSDLNLDPLLHLVRDSSTSQKENFYFGFITLTAVGYGEIIPNTPLARTVTIFASLSGVLYLAIYISSLINRPQQ